MNSPPGPGLAVRPRWLALSCAEYVRIQPRRSMLRIDEPGHQSSRAPISPSRMPAETPVIDRGDPPGLDGAALKRESFATVLRVMSVEVV